MRMNHSCEESCRLERFENGRVDIIAARDIEAGEELTQSYIGNDKGLPLTERRTILLNWNFHCECKKCTEEEAMYGCCCPSCNTRSSESDDPTGDARSDDTTAQHWK